MRMLARRGDVDAPNFMPAAFDQLLDVCDYSPDVVFVKPVLRDEDVQLVQLRLFAELDQRGEIDVAVNDILHSRLRLAHVVDAAANHQWLLDAIRSFYGHRVADTCFRNLKRIALDQDLAVRWRPRATLGNKRADADVAIVMDHKEHQIAPLRWSSLHLSSDRSARFSIANFGILQNHFDSIVVDRIETQHG